MDIAGKLLDTGLPEEQHVASGLLAVLADDDDFSNLHLLFRTTTEARVSSFIKRSFQVECPHDRSKVCNTTSMLKSTQQLYVDWCNRSQEASSTTGTPQVHPTMLRVNNAQPDTQHMSLKLLG